MVDSRKGLLVLLVDKSGSMQPMREATIEGMKGILDNHARMVKCGDMDYMMAYFAQFDYSPFSTISIKGNNDGYEEILDMVTLDWSELPDVSSYQPRGSTALYDAMGKMITTVGAKLSSMPEAERPGKINVFVITDGQENSSTEYVASAIKKMIQEQTDKYSWNFNFVGSDPRAILDAKDNLGISNVLNFNATVEGTRSAYVSMSTQSKSYFTGK